MKCAVLLKQGVAVTIVDLVTVRQFNLYVELLDWIGQSDPAMGTEPPAIYAVSVRMSRAKQRTVLQSWPYSLKLDHPLPTPPLWLSQDFSVPLDLESSYEATCRALRIA